MTTQIDTLCRRPAPTWQADVPDEPAPQVDRFADAWIKTFRCGIVQESRDALALLRKCGLEVPCARQTT